MCYSSCKSSSSSFASFFEDHNIWNTAMFSAAINWMPKEKQPKNRGQNWFLNISIPASVVTREKKESWVRVRESEKKKGSWEGGGKMVPCEETSAHSSVDTRNSGTSFHLDILCNLRNPRVWDNSKLHPSFLSSPTHHHDYYCPLPPLPPPPLPHLISLLLLLFLLLLLLLLTLSLFSLPSPSYTSGAWLGTSLPSTDFLQQS